VFTAIAARVGVAGARIMVHATANATKILVNDIQLSRREFAQEHVPFDGFSVSVKNRTVTVQFVNGIRLECDIDPRGFMTKIVIGVPWAFRGYASGLLADLTPSGSNTAPVSPGSNLRTIHEFGLTCEWEGREGEREGRGRGRGRDFRTMHEFGLTWECECIGRRRRGRGGISPPYMSLG
jgi:hypothetical protein